MFVGALLLTMALQTGELGLAGDDPPPVPDPPPTEEPVSPEPSDDPQPGLPGAVATLGLLAAAAALAAKTGAGAALGLRPPEDALVVFVSGHGQTSSQGTFGGLVDSMGLDPDDARYFDYRWVVGGDDLGQASQRAPVGPAALSLNGYLNGVGDSGRPIWLVGFSKGGATIAELVEAWDHGIPGPTDLVRGATLLDPPIARGFHGWLQSAGTTVGWIPDDGGYDPVECAFLWFGCRDGRAELGRASGVDVLVVRNPKAGITSFSDHPDGLRVVDAPDSGPSGWGQLLRNPLKIVSRLTEAHESVLRDPAVARCIVEEMWQPGSCSLEVQRLPSLRPVMRVPLSYSIL